MQLEEASIANHVGERAIRTGTETDMMSVALTAAGDGADDGAPCVARFDAACCVRCRRLPCLEAPQGSPCFQTVSFSFPLVAVDVGDLDLGLPDVDEEEGQEQVRHQTAHSGADMLRQNA